MGTGEQKPSILSLEDGQKLSRPNEEPTKPVINQKTKKTPHGLKYIFLKGSESRGSSNTGLRTEEGESKAGCKVVCELDQPWSSQTFGPTEF